MIKFYKFFYNPIINNIARNTLRPFRKILSKSLKIPVTGIIKIKSENNKEILFYSNETCPMTKHLFWEDRGCTFEFSNIFKHLVTESRTFMDIGSNVGYYSLLGKTINPNLDVFAFEPSKGPKYFLKRNIEINHLNSICVIEKALGDSIGSIDFYEEKNLKYPYVEHHASGIGNTTNSWGIENFLKYSVDLTTIDQISEEKNIQNIDLIKIDTEGTENLVLNGGLKAIIKNQPIIICEVLPDKIEEKIQHIVEDLLHYTIFQFQSKTNQLIQIDNIKFAIKNGETNYFFVPQLKIELLKSFIVKG